MNLKIYEIEKFLKLPDLSGASYDEIEEFKSNSYIKLENDIKAFLDYSDTEKIKKQPPISATMLIAPWGLGKTTTYDLIIIELLKRKEVNGYSIKIRAQDISNYYDNFKDKPIFKNIPRNADRFLFVVVNLFLKDSKFKKDFGSINIPKSGINIIETVLKEIRKRYTFFVIFIDELEEVVRSKNEIIPFILKACKDLLNGSSNIINTNLNIELNHFLSFIMACTDAAIYEISRLEQLEYQYGGIKRRIQEISIRDITLEEAIEYLVKLNKYCYDGKLVQSFTNMGAIFNVIARMAMKNPGYMKTFFTSLMNKTGSLSTGKVMNQIDGFFILENSNNFSLEYMETQRKSINIEIYNNWFRKFKNNESLINLLYLIIGEIKPFSLDELSSRFENKVLESDISSSITTFNEYIWSIHSNIKNAIIPVHKFRKDITNADIQNILTDLGYPIEETEDFIYSIKFKSEGEIPLGDFLESIGYYEIAENGEVITKFFFNTDNEILKELFPFLGSSTLSRIKQEFKKYIDKSEEFFILNPVLYNVIFPLPIPQEYNLLEDKNENVRLWSEISRIRKTEVYKSKISEILTEFLLKEKLIQTMSKENSTSEKKYVQDIDYFKEVIDKNQFLILENFMVSELSNAPINLLFWREIGDYESNTINEIIHILNKYSINELKNIHILILLSQSKIVETLINDLSNNLEYTIVKETLLSQFDITKFAFLNEVKEKYIGSYDDDKFNLALAKLLSPFLELFESCKDNINEKGLSFKLNSYMSPLSNIPQLLKYILYDFTNDYSNWGNFKLNKPYEKINPYGLSPRYSSSIDDWGDEKLKNNIANYLLVNGFIDIRENSLMISMPEIESKILQLIKIFNNENKVLTIQGLRTFFFDKSDTPALLKDVFLTDLENRGLISLKKEKSKKIESIHLIQIKESELRKDLNDIKQRISVLKVNDRNFFHIFTMKQNDFSLIFMEDFLNELESLLGIKSATVFNKNIIETRNVLFRRIYNVFDMVFNKIFTPLNIKLSNYKDKIINVRSEKFQLDHINNKLRSFGIKDIKLEDFEELSKLDEKFTKIIEKLEQPIKRDDLHKSVKEYYNINKTNVKVAGEPFSYLRLQENKKLDNFNEPYLNYSYYSIDTLKDQYFKAKQFDEINKINEYINKVDKNYLQIKSQISTGNFSGEIAPLIYEKIKDLSDFKFVKISQKLSSLLEIQSFLVDLNKEINHITAPISAMLRRKGRGRSESRLDKIYSSEKLILEFNNNIKNNIEFLKSKEIGKAKDLNDLLKNLRIFNFSSFKSKIDSCESLADLDEVSQDIQIKLQIEEDRLNSINSKMLASVLEYFTEFRNLKALKKIFNTFKGFENYAKLCDKFSAQRGLLFDDSGKYSVSEICNRLLSYKLRIEEGYEKVVGEKLDEVTQGIFLELNDNFAQRGWFNEIDLNKVIANFKLSNEENPKILKTLIEKELIEKRFYFK